MLFTIQVQCFAACLFSLQIRLSDSHLLQTNYTIYNDCICINFYWWAYKDLCGCLDLSNLYFDSFATEETVTGSKSEIFTTFKRNFDPVVNLQFFRKHYNVKLVFPKKDPSIEEQTNAINYS